MLKILFKNDNITVFYMHEKIGGEYRSNGEGIIRYKYFTEILSNYPDK